MAVTVPSSRILSTTGVNFTPSHFVRSSMETGTPSLGGKVSGLILLIHVAVHISIKWHLSLTNYRLAENIRINYRSLMSILLRQIARYIVQKAASDPEVREKTLKAVRSVVAETKQIAEKDNRTQAASQALRRAYEKLRSNR